MTADAQPWPSTEHRTLAEIAETEELAARAKRCAMPPAAHRRLRELRRRAALAAGLDFTGDRRTAAAREGRR